MGTFQPKEHLKGFTLQTKGFLVKDLDALSEEQSSSSPGGCARSALNVVAECAGFNRMVAGFLKTGTVTSVPPEQREALLASFDTKEKARAFLDETTDELIAAIDGVDESTLGETTSDLLGFPMTRFAIAEMPAGHMMYHDGQLTYLQTLHGDNNVHWF